MIIVFSGLDGTGKTTQAMYLLEHIRRQGIKCRYRHAIKNTLYYFITHNVIGKASPGARSGLEKGLRRPDKGLSFALLSTVKKAFLLLDILYFNLRYSPYRRSRSKMLICDRYFCDEMVQARFLRMAGGAFMGAYKKLMLKPDILFFADVAPEVAAGRKDENHTPDYFSVKAELYDALLEKDSMVKLPDLDKDRVRELTVSTYNEVYKG